VSVLYLYAVARGVAPGALGAGLAGEPIAALEVAGVLALAGRLEAVPEIDRAALEGHDAVVRRLAAASDALLPARFGSVVDDARALGDALSVWAEALAGALDLVAGREQMTLRIYGSPPEREVGEADADAATAPVDTTVEPGRPGAPAAPADASTGPGARYLAARLRAHRRARAPSVLAPVRSALAPLVHAERVEVHATPPLVASVYHLIARGRAAEYRAALDGALPALAPARAAVSGPWPPYAFAPGLGALGGAAA